MQLTTVGKEIWRAARKAEQLEEAGADNPAVQARLQKLRQVEAFRKRGAVWSEIQDLVGISRATYYRWQRRLQEEGLKGLAPKPRRPRHLRRKVCWTPDLLVRIEALRKQHPTWGRWPIWLTLRKQPRKQLRQAERPRRKDAAHLQGRVPRPALALMDSRATARTQRLSRRLRHSTTDNERSPPATNKGPPLSERPGSSGVPGQDAGQGVGWGEEGKKRGKEK